MWTAPKIRQTFFDFFKGKGHEIVTSAPMVIKDDPTLMFTNAGMNQFKDIFLGNTKPKNKRVANTQKCLRVSGKHNDLEEVGVDTYHHTMFEMLGNWSFGDYFKKEAIEWAWQLLTEVYGIDKGRLYATVFGGDAKDGLGKDEEAIEFWGKVLPKERIIEFDKKDNFWEMGSTGPCGPCSEIHIDLRDDDERKKEDGKELVNTGHPEVIEIWNLVFIQYERAKGGNLKSLPKKHVDTGMGFERLCTVLQGKKSNYDTDVFLPLIEEAERISYMKSDNDEKQQVALRVVADHVRAIAFSIADGQLPSNTGAGYVIRRILRRAVRYGYSFLQHNNPFLYRLVPILVKQMGETFPELKSQQELIEKVIKEEEENFLRTLEKGIDKLNSFLTKRQEEVLPDILQLVLPKIKWRKDGTAPVGEIIQVLVKELEQGSKRSAENKQITISGELAFELYDTYGFPIDLTQLMAQEIGWNVDVHGFEKAAIDQVVQALKDKWQIDMDKFQQLLLQQKKRSKKATAIETEDWVVLAEDDVEEFIGYERLEAEVKITRYRKIKAKGKQQYQLVFNLTPFYAESGGQVGDTGYIEAGGEKIEIIDTKKENNLIVHFTDTLPADLTKSFKAVVNHEKRLLTESNHSATHLLHQALREILGEHVQQKGSLVHPDYFRFDFSHFQKVTDEELAKIEALANQRIRENIELNEKQNTPMEEAKKMGAMALFGEKYGDTVRVIQFGESIELCGGCHVSATGKIGLFKITSESAIAAGIRRIEAITAETAEKYVSHQLELIKKLKALLKNPKDLQKSVSDLLKENQELQKKIEATNRQQASNLKGDLLKNAEEINGVKFIGTKVELDNNAVKDLAFQLNRENDNLFLILGNESNGKVTLTVAISNKLVSEKHLNAGNIVRELAKEIDGGGGGQPHFATAGGKKVSGIKKALERAKEFLVK
ncbi:MAG: alanine--tRNA ligase [Flavobacteriales bacterium]|nr:MAG: alanine--tRNA ligase [Flavobacteriales bacterium]